jgi:hypothetical protein
VHWLAKNQTLACRAEQSALRARLAKRGAGERGDAPRVDDGVDLGEDREELAPAIAHEATGHDCFTVQTNG